MASSSLHVNAVSNLRARSTLEKLEAQFLSALQNDDTEGQMLVDFYTSFSDFQEELQDSHLLLSVDLKEDIANFASLVVATSTNLVEASSPSIIDEFKSNLLEALTPSQPDAPPERQHSPRYIEHSLRWLRQNLHNPYPSRSVRSGIASKTNSSVKDVDAWFIDVRKRIGWSHLRQSRFGNRMGKIVDAAKRFFTGCEPHRPLDTVLESEFASIAATVEELYQEKCANSTLASCLDDAVRDLTPDLQRSLSTQKRTQSKTTRRRHQPYPSPELSPSLSSQPLSPEPQAISLPTNLKRSRSLSAGYSTDSDEEDARAAKRLRHASITSSHNSQLSCYPSPAASVAMKQAELPAEQHASSEMAPTSGGTRELTRSDAGVARSTPPREAASRPSTPSHPSPPSINEILDHAAFSSAAAASPPTSSIVSLGTYNPFNAFAALFAAFTGTGTDPIGSTSSQPLSQLPLLNLVDDVPPANVQVEYDQSWSVGYCADELVPAMDTSITDYGFDDFGSSLYSDPTVADMLGGQSQQWGSFWLASPSQESYASSNNISSNTISLPPPAQPIPLPPSSIPDSSASHLYLSTPSPASGFHCSDIPAEGMRSQFPLSDYQTPSSSDPLARLTDKAKELMELEARCAALRNELVSVC